MRPVGIEPTHLPRKLAPQASGFHQFPMDAKQFGNNMGAGFGAELQSDELLPIVRTYYHIRTTIT